MCPVIEGLLILIIPLIHSEFRIIVDFHHFVRISGIKVDEIEIHYWTRPTTLCGINEHRNLLMDCSLVLSLFSKNQLFLKFSNVMWDVFAARTVLFELIDPLFWNSKRTFFIRFRHKLFYLDTQFEFLSQFSDGIIARVLLP